MKQETLQSLALVLRAPSKVNAHAVHLRSAVFAAFLVALLFVVFRSYYSPEPIQLTDVVVLVNNESLTGSIQLVETRKYIGKSNETIGVIRNLHSEADPTRRFALDSGLFSATPGPFSSTGVITLPGSIQGRWCLSTSYTWWPSWSQAEFIMESPVICFETTPNA